MEKTKIVIIDNVRSAHNVGSIFRTCDGAGVKLIILVGYTPSPVDRFGREQPEIKKTSLGASTIVPFETKENGPDIAAKVQELKREGFTIVAVEQVPTAVSLYDFSVPEKVVYIVGNEITGVSKELLGVSDVVVEIPMLGRKESLNVGVTTGIILFNR